MPLTEAPAFISPPRNLCIKEGATAKFEGRVRSVTGWEAWESWEEVLTPSGDFFSLEWIW